MKLSEAIMLGSTLAPQGFGEIEDPKGRLCAFGAAARAVGCNSRVTSEVAELWRWTLKARFDTQCPACRRPYLRVAAEVVIHLNDEHAWTRERIAEWVASVEPDSDETKDEQTDVGQGPVEVALEVPAL